MTEHDGGPDFRDGMPFLGGARWIDLLNSTLSPDGGATVLDFLAEDHVFARWLVHAGLASAGNLAAERSSAARLRGELRPAFDRLAAGEPVPAVLERRINALLSAAPFVRELQHEATDATYRLGERPVGSPAGVAAQLAEDFARFLTDHEAARLKHCDNPACTMVFYDRGKNNRRRWCSSAVCGNRDKVAKYRARKAGRG